MEDSVKHFIKDLRKDCKEAGICLQLRPSKRVIVSPGMKCAGFFDHNKRLLVVSKHDPRWLSILTHESAHMDQWLENSDLWQKDEQFGNQVVEDWLNGKEIKNIGRAITNVINLELDCEKRALKKIAQYDLPINTATYIQRANDNILHYRWVQKNRYWDNNMVELHHKMPTRFMSNSYYKKLSPKIERIYLEAVA